MAISYTRNDLINRAMRLTGRYPAGQTLPAEVTNDAALTLNLMLKEWQSHGWYLWLEEEATCFFANDQREYTIGSAASDDHATLSHAKAELASAYSAAVVSINLDSTSGMTSGDNIGIEISGNVLQWATISAIGASGHVTLNSGLTHSAAENGHVYAYTTKMKRPLAIRNPRLHYESGEEVELELIDRDEYFRLPTKTTEGKPVRAYYNPKKNSGKLFVWPEPDSVADRLNFTALMPFAEFSAAGDSIDMPEEWWNALTWSLAAEVGAEFGLSVERIVYLEGKARVKRQLLEIWDQEDAPMRLVMDDR